MSLRRRSRGRSYRELALISRRSTSGSSPGYFFAKKSRLGVECVALPRGRYRAPRKGALLKKLIFVYTNAQLRITGTQTVKEFPFSNLSFDLATEVPMGESGEVNVGRGIYVAGTANDKEQLEVEATSGKEGTDYDLEEAGKTIWPGLRSPKDPVYLRVREAFPQLDDTQLNSFAFDDKKV